MKIECEMGAQVEMQDTYSEEIFKDMEGQGRLDSGLEEILQDPCLMPQ